MRVGFDLDEVLYPWVDTLRHWLHSFEGRRLRSMPTPTEFHFHESWGFSSREELAAAARRGSDAGVVLSWGRAPRGASHTLHLLRHLGHEVHLITARGEHYGGARFREHTEQWLAFEALPFDSLTFTEDKTSVPVDVYVDDLPANVEAVAGTGAVSLLMDAPHNRGVSGLRRITGVGDVVGVMSDMGVLTPVRV